ncbi:MAG: FtsQ-type POTRA domain-containing protein [Bdellovibrionales bacterium]|nr:FtsQ-type POTRA domain-containing protein [Bdellovibrionales bacterium]
MSLVLAGGIFWALQESRVFAVQAIPLEWRERLDGNRMEVEIAREIEASIGVRFGNVMGKRPWEIDLDALRKSIRDLPWITEAHIQRVFPDRLVVSILPKKPLAVIVSNRMETYDVKIQHGKRRGRTVQRERAVAGMLIPISQAGELMPEWKSQTVPDVPFLRGEGFVNDTGLRARAVELIRALPHDGILARSNLAEISWVDVGSGGGTAGFSLMLLSPRTEIRLGNSDIDIKLRRVAQVLNYLSSQGKRAPVIDSTSVKKVVVRAQHRP